jgi:hypothetical protein
MQFGALCGVAAMMGCTLLSIRLTEVIPYRAAPSKIHRLYVVVNHRMIFATYAEHAAEQRSDHSQRWIEAAREQERQFSDALLREMIARLTTEGLEVKVRANSPEEMEATFAKEQLRDVAAFAPDATLFLTLSRLAHWDDSFSVYKLEYDVSLQATPAESPLWRANIVTPTWTRKKWRREGFAKLTDGIVGSLKRANVI